LKEESRSARHTRSADTGTTKEIKKKSFRQLFSREELWFYGIAALVYIGLGVLFQNWVLNLAIGILFIIAWIWIAPPLLAKLRSKQLQALFHSIFKRANSAYTGNPNKLAHRIDITTPQRNQPEDEAGKGTPHPSMEECHEKDEIKLAGQLTNLRPYFSKNTCYNVFHIWVL